MYRISNRFYATQDEAKPALAELGEKLNTIGAYETDVPLTKDALIVYLNEVSAAAVAATPTPNTRPLPEVVLPSPSASPHHARALHNIDVEDEIERASFADAVRLAEHANARVGWHLKLIKDEGAKRAASDML